MKMESVGEAAGNSWSVRVGQGGPELKIHFHCDQGGRKYMEDVICGSLRDQPEPYAFFAVYDGHGGTQAAQFAKENLHDELVNIRGFWSKDDDQILAAIKEAFVATHRLMWKALPTWPKTVSGFPCTAGTTASVVVIKNNKIYVAHVGDSAVVVGSRDNSCGGDLKYRAHLVTVDHKPESPKERKRIESNGGKVMTKAGVHRVVWRRPRPSHKGPVRRSTLIDDIPFLAVARALGDLWSYNSDQDVFVVSPDPDTAVYDLDLTKHRSIILASDGLWNMVRPFESILKVESATDNPAEALVNLALRRWSDRKLRADNTSVIVLTLQPPRSQDVSRTPSEASTAVVSSSSRESSPDYDWDVAFEGLSDKADYLPDAFSPLPRTFGLGCMKNAMLAKPLLSSLFKKAPINNAPSTASAAKLKSTLAMFGCANQEIEGAGGSPSLKRCLLEDGPYEPIAKKLKDEFESAEQPSRAVWHDDNSPMNATSVKSPIKLDSSAREDSPSVGVVSPTWPEPSLSEGGNSMFKAAQHDNINQSSARAANFTSNKFSARKLKLLLKARGRQNQLPQRYLRKRLSRKCSRYALRRKR